MPVSALDPISALVVIDLQPGIVGRPTSRPAAAVAAHAARLTEAFGEHHRPVVLVHVAGAAPGRTEHTMPVGSLLADWADLVRSAHEHGYNVSFAPDAMTGTSIEARDTSAARTFPRPGATGATDDELASLRTRP